MEIIDLQYIPGGPEPVAHVSQNDNGRPFKIRLWEGAVPYNLPSGTTAVIDGRKPDGKAFSYDDVVSVSGNEFTITTKLQMTIISGFVECEIRFKKTEYDIGTLNFKMKVEPSPVNEEVDMSESELPVIIAQATEQMLTAEAYARGTRYGVPVTEGQAGYHDNSKFWKEQTQQYATQAETAKNNAANSASAAAGSASTASNKATEATNQALKSEGHAVGKQNGIPVGSSSPYYHNNAEYYAQQANASADRAESYSIHTPYIGPNGNWWVWNSSSGVYIDSGVDASITVRIAEIIMLDPTATPYVENTGTDTDPVFHLYIPRGKGIANIAKIDTSGLVDTYKITYSDGTFTTYTVKNGKGISSITKEGSEDLVDTYTITYNDGTTTSFTVTNGKTAYQSAVDGGYPGTEEEFETALANFEQYYNDAVQAASDAADSADDASDSAVVAHQEYLAAKEQADRAEQYADFVEPHFLYQDNCLWIRDDSTIDFAVADNCLWIKMTS